jgi:hypothetical protein
MKMIKPKIIIFIITMLLLSISIFTTYFLTKKKYDKLQFISSKGGNITVYMEFRDTRKSNKIAMEMVELLKRIQNNFSDDFKLSYRIKDFHLRGNEDELPNYFEKILNDRE